MIQSRFCIPQVLVAGALLSACASALAGLHSICYQGPVEMRGGTEVLKMVVGCADDSGAPCSIRPAGAQVWGYPLLLQTMSRDQQTWQALRSVQAAGQFEFYEYVNTRNNPGVEKLVAEIVFHGSAQVRYCDVTPIASAFRALRNRGGADGVLTGFSTDASGVVTTGTWRVSAAGPAAVGSVPADFVAVGGGAEAEPNSAIVRTRLSQYSAIPRQWESATYTRALGKPMATVSHVVGLRLDGLLSDAKLQVPDSTNPYKDTDLQTLLKRAEGSSVTLAPAQPFPTWSEVVFAGAGLVAVGGDIHAQGQTSVGQFAVASRPSDRLSWLQCVLVSSPCPLPTATSWDVASMSEQGRITGSVSTRLNLLPEAISIRGKTWQLRSRYVEATSAPGLQPAADVAGLRGEYAVTAAGGAINWRRFNPSQALVDTRLASIVPRLDQGGASVTTYAGGIANTTTVSAFALGIKLVPGGTPPEVRERPKADFLSASAFCELSLAAAESSLCRGEQERVLIQDACKLHPDLTKMGLCRPN